MNEPKEKVRGRDTTVKEAAEGEGTWEGGSDTPQIDRGCIVCNGSGQIGKGFRLIR